MSQAVLLHGPLDGQGLRRKLREHFGFARFRPGQAQGGPIGHRGARHDRHHAHRLGQERLLPAPGAGAGGDDGGGQPPDRPDEGPGRRPPGAGQVGRRGSTARSGGAEEREALEAIEGAGRVRLHHARAPGHARLPRTAEARSPRSTCSWWTRPTARASGGTTSAPITWPWARPSTPSGRPTVLALTATATPDVIEDIKRQLRIADAEVVHMGVDRPNLHIEVRSGRARGGRQARRDSSGSSASPRGPGSSTRRRSRRSKELTEFLASIEGIAAAAYHGQAQGGERHEQPGPVHERRAQGDGRHQRLRPGDRQARHPLRDPPPCPGDARGVLPGGRPRRPRRPGRPLHPAVRRGRQGAPPKFFQAGRYPTGEDLVNAHHALKRMAEGEGSPTFERLRALSPVPKTRLKQALNLFKARNVVREEAGEIRLLVAPTCRWTSCTGWPATTASATSATGSSSINSIEFAQTRNCRWSYLIDYFGRDDGSEARPSVRCGHCDNCAGLIVGGRHDYSWRDRRRPALSCSDRSTRRQGGSSGRPRR